MEENTEKVTGWKLAGSIALQMINLVFSLLKAILKSLLAQSQYVLAAGVASLVPAFILYLCVGMWKFDFTYFQVWFSLLALRLTVLDN